MEIVHYSEKLKQNVFSFTDACFSELGKKLEPEKLYEKCGFIDCAGYNDNSYADVFMKLEL